MTERNEAHILTNFTNLKVEEALEDPLVNNNKIDECETAEEAITTDSDEYLTETLRPHRFQYSTSTMSNETLRASNLDVNEHFFSCNGNIDFNNIQIPIVGYEIMEERARFTVFKLRVENKASGSCWYVFRRYTDFVRLCNRLKHLYPHIVLHLPRKRWIGNNFDPLFLEDRVNGLQTLVNAILSDTDLLNSHDIQDFFCLSEPPIYSETNEESRAILESLEETIYHLKQQILDKERTIDTLHDALREKTIENENLKRLMNPSVCQKYQKDIINSNKIVKESKDI